MTPTVSRRSNGEPVNKNGSIGHTAIDIGYSTADRLQWRPASGYSDRKRPVRVICIGAGISGIYSEWTTIDQLSHSFEIIAGIRVLNSMKNVELTIYEKNSDFGGTWLENRYIGCACDIPAHSYQLASEPKSDWSSFYAPANEIGEYWKSIAFKYGLERFTSFNHQVKHAQWDEAQGIWKVELEDLKNSGATIRDQADFVIQAVGGLNNWKWPDVEGRDSFQGHIVHSAKWDPYFDYSDKRVALIGSGSTAIQILPKLVTQAKSVDQYVRGATWIGFPFLEEEMPKQNDGTNYFYTEAEKEGFEDNLQSYEYRHRLMSKLNSVHPITQLESNFQSMAKGAMHRSMAEKLAKRPDIAKFLTPTFPVCCRRLTPGPGYLESLVEDHVGFITDPIKKFTKVGIDDQIGNHREYDAIICATGFDTTYKPRFPLIGRNGVDLRDRWSDFPETYCSLAVDGYPNYFIINGPNSAVGSGDLIIIFETEVDYALQCIDKLQSQGYKSIDVKKEAVEDFQVYSQTYFKSTVFGTDCRTWYKSGRSTGPVTALWPGSTLHALETLKTPRWEDFNFDLLPNSKGKRFHYLGNGSVEADDPESKEDRAWYITKNPHSALVSKLGQVVAAKFIQQLEAS